jgi:hypothetical protein
VVIGVKIFAAEHFEDRVLLAMTYPAGARPGLSGVLRDCGYVLGVGL